MRAREILTLWQGLYPALEYDTDGTDSTVHVWVPAQAPRWERTLLAALHQELVEGCEVWAVPGWMSSDDWDPGVVTNLREAEELLRRRIQHILQACRGLDG